MLFLAKTCPIDRIDGVGLLATATRIVANSATSQSSSVSSVSSSASSGISGTTCEEDGSQATAAASGHKFLRKRKVAEVGMCGLNIASEGGPAVGSAVEMSRQGVNSTASSHQAISTLLSMSNDESAMHLAERSGGASLLFSRIESVSATSTIPVSCGGGMSSTGASGGDNVADVLSWIAKKRMFPSS